MKKKSFLKIGGAMLLLALVLNIQYAWGGDGVKDHPLHLEVLAQSMILLVLVETQVRELVLTLAFFGLKYQKIVS